MTCSRDTNGDGDCGRPLCPECGGGQLPGRTPAPRPEPRGEWKPDVVLDDGKRIVVVAANRRLIDFWLRDQGLRPTDVTIAYTDRGLMNLPTPHDTRIVEVAPNAWPAAPATQRLREQVLYLSRRGAEVVSVDDR